MKTVGFVGWRGMVGAVLLERMQAEQDFTDLNPVFLTTSQLGQPGPTIVVKAGHAAPPTALHDAYCLDTLQAMDIIVSCQGGDYTRDMLPTLRRQGWPGYWLDAASTLRLADDSVIVLDPINRPLIDQALNAGIKNFIGGNCTVSLMLMAIGGLLRHEVVEWLSVMTYQAASGAGAQALGELIQQMGCLQAATADQPAAAMANAALHRDKQITACMRSPAFPQTVLKAPLAGSLLPWIDQALDTGQSREEWKGQVEAHKILGRQGKPMPIDGLCVRIGAMRCHSQALTIKLRADIPITDIEALIAEAHDWVTVVPNQRDATLTQLTPAAVAGRLHVPIGRLRKLAMGPDYLTAFTVGDQLLWGAAEPLRRMLRLLI